MVTQWTPLLAALAVAWVAPARAPFLLWSAVVLPAAAILLMWRPPLVWVGVG